MILQVQGCHVKLRPVTPDDAKATRDIIEAVAREGVHDLVDPEYVRGEEAQRRRIEALKREDDCWIVAEVDGVVSGFSYAARSKFRKARHSAEIGVCLAAPYRGLGIGTPLIVALDEWAREVGVRKLWTQSFGTNEKSRRAYERAGYGLEGVQPNQYMVNGQLVEGLIWGKWLG